MVCVVVKLLNVCMVIVFFDFDFDNFLFRVIDWCWGCSDNLCSIVMFFDFDCDVSLKVFRFEIVSLIFGWISLDLVFIFDDRND